MNEGKLSWIWLLIAAVPLRLILTSLSLFVSFFLAQGVKLDNLAPFTVPQVQLCWFTMEQMGGTWLARLVQYPGCIAHSLHFQFVVFVQNTKLSSSDDISSLPRAATFLSLLFSPPPTRMLCVVKRAEFYNQAPPQRVRHSFSRSWFFLFEFASSRRYCVLYNNTFRRATMRSEYNMVELSLRRTHIGYHLTRNFYWLQQVKVRRVRLSANSKWGGEE